MCGNLVTQQKVSGIDPASQVIDNKRVGMLYFGCEQPSCPIGGAIITKKSSWSVIAVAIILGIFILPAFSQNQSEPPDIKDTSKASGIPAELMEKAKQGERLAQYVLGVSYDTGLGVNRNPEKAIRWYRAAALQGHATAQFSLGAMYAEGDGGPQDFEEAIRWYQASAGQGHGHAQNNLGDMYSNGQGVSQNYVRAYMWFSLAVSGITDNFKETAIKNRDLTGKKMTSEEIAEAMRLAREWKSGSSKNP